MRSFIVILVALFANMTHAASFLEDFNSGVANPNLFVSATPSFSVSYTGGKAVMTRTSGTDNGRLFLASSFQVLGDYVATVEVDRTLLGSGSLGIFMGDSSSDLSSPAFSQNVYFRPNDLVQANIFATPNFADDVISDAGSDLATMRIRRVGNSVFNEVNLGSGFVTINTRTNAALAGSARIGLFLFEEIHMSDNLLGTFDNFSIQADEFVNFVPEPSCIVLLFATSLFPWRLFRSSHGQRPFSS